MPTKLQNGQSMLFIGDSITDCDRRGNAVPLGNGYVKMFTDMLAVHEPQKNVTIYNRGISGNCVTDLHARWHDDALALAPDWLAIKIGINDVHRYLRDDDETISPQRFREVYAELLNETRDALPRCHILLIQPFYIVDPVDATPWEASVLETLGDYWQVIESLARKHRLPMIDMHTRFQRLLRHKPAATFCPEPVHPNATGHYAIAFAVYETLSQLCN
ncbi:MAG: SGNH/GDSL hydrolase family protein [Deferribacteres bacterium]|nr:SGNH/GDSL hydrolase family protein [Deferribacteres bacterium]